MKPQMPVIPGKGLLKGMKVTLKTLFTRPVTVNYPKVKETPAPRARGVIALDPDACTVCMLCARQCPDWCIYIEGHKEERPPSRPGGRPRVRATLDRFDIDYALCMYCGICDYEYSESEMGEMLHNQDRLLEWLDTVPAAPALER